MEGFHPKGYTLCISRFFILVFVIFLPSCVNMRWHQFTIIDTPYTPSDSFKNGVYIWNRKYAEGIIPAVFYEDGSCAISRVNFDSVEDAKDKFVDLYSYFGVDNPIGYGSYRWGEYRIEGNKIRIQVFADGESDIPGRYYAVLEYSGKVVNDTTFVLNTFKNGSYNRPPAKIEQEFRYEKRMVKPDPTFNWLKYEKNYGKNIMKRPDY